MKLAEIQVRNYRSLFGNDDEARFDVPLSEGMNAFVGPNNTGKSNILRAVALALDAEFPFDPGKDVPGGMNWAFPRVTLRFEVEGKKSVEKTLLKYAREYELSASGGEKAYADANEIRLITTYQGKKFGTERQIFIGARGAGNRKGDLKKLDAALAQFRKCMRFVYIESGQNLEQLLAGKFREILRSVIREHLTQEFENAERRRTGYIEGLQDDLLGPLRDRIRDVVAGLFPEVTGVTLLPDVPNIDTTLSNVAVSLEDAVVGSLADKGTGLRGGVLVAMLRYLADQSKRSMVFAIEEPEAFLHPAAQEELRDDLESLAERSDVTVLVTTHSPFIVSRDPKAQLMALTKDVEGRTRVVGRASGDEPYAVLLGGLFRESALSEIIDRAARLPTKAKGVVFVEGTTDANYMRIACEKAERSDLVSDLYVVPTGGASKLLLEAALMKMQTPLPVLALFDSDEPGRNALKTLTDKLGYAKGRETLSYAELFKGTPQDVEAEDLLPEKLLQRFVEEQGEAIVLAEKINRKELGRWHYGLTATGKDLIGAFLDAHASAADTQLWLELLVMIRGRLGLAD